MVQLFLPSGLQNANIREQCYSQRYILSLGVYFLFLLAIAPIQLRTADTYYYWDWSRHLDWSYFDGPPLIAYGIKIATHLFGDTLFALASVAISSTALCCYVLYKTGRLFLTKTYSYEVVLFWLFSPLTTLDLLKQTTYDNLQTLFWILSLYFCIRFIKKDQIKDLYWIGVTIALSFLSKYTTIILVLGFLFYLSLSTHRYLFKNKHFYAAIGLSFIIISPILIWNYQHHWVSFQYHLTTHAALKNNHPFWIYLSSFLIFVNGLIMPPLAVGRSRFSPRIMTHSRDSLPFCLLICLSFFLFYLFFSFKIKTHYVWFQPFLITSALLTPFWRSKVKKPLLIIYILASVLILLNGVLLVSKPHYYSDLKKIRVLNQTHHSLPNLVMTGNWLEARPLFFLNNKPAIYTLDCGQSDQNQYLLWDKALQAALHQTKDFLYIGHRNAQACLTQHGFVCTPWLTQDLFAYYCLTGSKE